MMSSVVRPIKNPKAVIRKCREVVRNCVSLVVRNLLNVSSFGVGTRPAYRVACNVMRSGFDDNGVLCETVPSIDELIAEMMQDEHQEAREPQLGVSALAALGHYHPKFDRRTGEIALPYARQALKGWQELGPAKLRLGWPEELLALIVGAVLVLRRRSWMSARKVWEICPCT